MESRIINTIKPVFKSTSKTCVWIVKMTLVVSIFIFLLRYFNLLPYLANFLSPVFNTFGLPGEAALAYVTGYFVNVYSAIAVAVTIGLDTRAMTILAVMVLCSHNMIVETAVQKKTGTSAILLVILRTFSGIILAWVLNAILPNAVTDSSIALAQSYQSVEFLPMLREWAVTNMKLIIKMVVLIYSLNILQAIMAEYGVIKLLSKLLRPLLAVFGLPARCSLLWIVGNVIGLAYGAAAMMEEVDKGKLSKNDVNLTNIHISISHSNLEDMFLFASVGAIWWIVLLSRWFMSIILVWGYRLFNRMWQKFCINI